MMPRRLHLLMLFLLLAGGAEAMLPPDSDVREPQIRAHRIRLKAQYEENIQKRQKEATEAYQRATAAIGVPPWELDGVLNGQSAGNMQPKAQQQRIEENAPKSRILMSIVLFILIASVVLWVRVKTRDVEE